MYSKANMVMFAKRLAFHFNVAELQFCVVPSSTFKITRSHVSEYKFTEFKVAESVQRIESQVGKLIVMTCICSNG